MRLLSNETSARVLPRVSALPAVETGAAVYEAMRERLGEADIVRLNSNEGAFAPFPSALAAVNDAASHLHRYPQASSMMLVEAISAFHRVSRDEIAVAPGATSLIFLLSAAMLGPDDEVVVPWPTFPQYAVAVAQYGGRLVRVPLKDHTVDLDGLLAAVTPRTRTLVVVNPNNPTGTRVSLSALEDFLARVPPHVLVVIDEAYIDYAEDRVASASSYARYRRVTDVVVLRTFSKIYGLAGARVGYALGPADVVAALTRLQPPFAMNQVAIAAAAASFGCEDEVVRRATTNEIERQRVADELTRMGIGFVPSCANFMLVDTSRSEANVFERLAELGVLVRQVRDYPGWLRVTVGQPEENVRFVDALRRVLAGDARQTG